MKKAFFILIFVILFSIGYLVYLQKQSEYIRYSITNDSVGFKNVDFKKLISGSSTIDVSSTLVLKNFGNADARIGKIFLSYNWKGIDLGNSFYNGDSFVIPKGGSRSVKIKSSFNVSLETISMLESLPENMKDVTYSGYIKYGIFTVPIKEERFK